MHQGTSPKGGRNTSEGKTHKGGKTDNKNRKSGKAEGKGTYVWPQATCKGKVKGTGKAWVSVRLSFVWHST